MQLQQYKSKLEQAKGQYNLSTKKFEECNREEKRLKKYQIDLEKAQAFLQQIAQETQNQLRFHIKDIVQLALDTCWPGEVEFDITFDVKRGKTEAPLHFYMNGNDVDITDFDGGGIVDIVELALLVVAWSLGKTRNSIALDQPFKNLSEDLRPQGLAILKELSKELELQFIIVTHHKDITELADRVFEVTRHKVGEFYESEVRLK